MSKVPQSRSGGNEPAPEPSKGPRPGKAGPPATGASAGRKRSADKSTGSRSGAPASRSADTGSRKAGGGGAGKAAGSDTTAKKAKKAKSAKSSKPAKPAKSAKPAKPAKSSKPAKPTKSTVTAETAKPPKSTTATETTKAGNAKAGAKQQKKARPGRARPAATGAKGGGAGPPGSPERGRPTLTSRAAILALVVCAITLSLAYPVREYVLQRAEIAKLQEERQSSEQNVSDLEQRHEQLQDPTHIEREARDRLHYQYPGESNYVIVGDDDEDEQQEATEETDPWFTRLWQSVEEADQVTEQQEEIPEAEPPER